MAENIPKQLLKKDGAEQYSDIHPINYIQNITDAENGLSLEQYLEYPNVIRLGNAVSRVGARGQVPKKMRRARLILMYYAGAEICEQFIGNASDASSNWTNSSYWRDINIDTLVPDEEDLTTIDNKVQFKDKLYNLEEFSGYGVINVRKYISNNKNLIYQDIFKYENTIYIIKYDFDLDGNTITLPNNCILYFQGGSIKNGYIKLNKAKILGWEIRKDFLIANNDDNFAEGQILYLDNTYKYRKENKWITFITQDKAFVTVVNEEVIINSYDDYNKVEGEILYLRDSDINVDVTNEVLIIHKAY